MSAPKISGRILAAAVVALCCWVLRDFAQALMTACVIAVASWPLYVRFRARLPRAVGSDGAAVLFTAGIAVFVLAPLVFAGVALAGEAHSLLVAVAAADGKGMATPAWLADVPVMGPWLAVRWQGQIAHPGALLALTQRTDPADLMALARSLVRVALRQALIVVFTILLLCFFYRQGAELERRLHRMLHAVVGESADRYVDVAVRSVRACANSMLAVGLFDAAAAALAYTLAGAPRALAWAAITGALAALPFVGYVAVAVMALQSAVMGAGASALPSLALGCAVLLAGDKIVRPAVARGGISLPFAWLLMGCIGGFGAFGLAGLVIGPLVLALGAEMWEQRTARAAAESLAALQSPRLIG